MNQPLNRKIDGGLYIASITHLAADGESIDTEATLRHINAIYCMGAPTVTGVVVLGTTGLGHAIPHQEKLQFIRALGEYKKQQPFRESFRFITGTGTVDKNEAWEVVSAAHQAELDGVLALLPTDGSEVFSFLAVGCDSADNSPDLLIYDMPRNPVNLGIAPQFMTTHAGFPAFVGAKSSTEDIMVLDQWIQAGRSTGRDIFVGEDTLISAGLQDGATGVISGTGNTPRGLEILCHLYQDYEEDRGASVIAFTQEALSAYVEGLVAHSDGYRAALMENLLVS